MLQSIRDRATGWIAWVIIGLISIPFALWGINQYFGPEPYVYVAEVNGVKITQGELTRGIQNQRERMRQMFGKSFRPEMFNEAIMKQQVLDQLIDRELLAQAAVAAGLRVGDAELSARIRGTDIFKEEGGAFSQSRYERLVGGAGLSTKGYEAQERRSVLMQQLRTGIAASALSSPAEIDGLLRLRDQERDLAFIKVEAKTYLDKAEVSDERIKTYYEENKHRFMSDERVEVDYVELNLVNLARNIHIEEAALRTAYDEQLSRFAEDEQRQASHILIPVEGGADAATEQAAKKQAEELLAQLRAGADFATLAKQYSKDPGSAAKGGELGFFGRGVMDKTFEEAVFNLKKDEISEPVRSAYGYHLIKLEAIKGGGVKSFADVRKDLERDLQRQQAESQFYEQSERLANLSYEHPDTLEPAAEQLGLKLKQSDWLTRDKGEAMFADPRLREAAFSEDVLNGGHNSELIEMTPEHFVVLRLHSHEVSVQRPLEEVRMEIFDILRADTADEQAKAEAERLLAEAQQGKTLADLVAGSELKQATPGWVKRDAAGLDAALRQRAFTLPHPQADAAVYDVVSLGKGDYALLAVNGLRDGDPSKVKEEDRARLQKQLVNGRGEAEFSALLKGFRSRSDIHIFEKNL